jgi:hypothetical protein
MIVHHCAALFRFQAVPPMCVDTVTGVTNPVDVVFWSLVALAWLAWVFWPFVHGVVTWLQDGDTLAVIGVLVSLLVLACVWLMDSSPPALSFRDRDESAVDL